MFEARPAVRELCLQFIEALLAHALQAMACNTVHRVEARCCRWILTLHDRTGRNALPLTHEHLSAMLGVQRSAISLVIGSLQSAGLIHQGRGVLHHAHLARGLLDRRFLGCLTSFLWLRRHSHLRGPRWRARMWSRSVL